ncbi:MAG: glycosyltransferase [Candidatus Hodarchaeota archaeon]
MKVLFLPEWSANPYQCELAAALEKRGVTVVKGTGGFYWLPILGAIWVHGKPDVLHLHWTHSYLLGRNRANSIIKFIRFISEVFVAKFLGIKIIWTVHNLWDHERQDLQLEVFFNRFLVRIYDQLIVHCSFARKSLLQSYQLPDHLTDKIYVIPHGNYMNTYANHVTRKKARARLGLGDGNIVFLYFGTIRPYKGVHRMADAFRKLHNPRVRLLIVGNPANKAIRRELRRFCESDKRIRTFLKFVPDEDIQLYMNAADVVVLPFQDILTSGSALLAMSFGKPIIVPRLGCIPEVLDKKGGFLYNHDEEQGLLIAMRRASLANLGAMGKYNYEKAKRFDWNMIAQKTCVLYQL